MHRKIVFSLLVTMVTVGTATLNHLNDKPFPSLPTLDITKHSIPRPQFPQLQKPAVNFEQNKNSFKTSINGFVKNMVTSITSLSLADAPRMLFVGLLVTLLVTLGFAAVALDFNQLGIELRDGRSLDEDLQHTISGLQERVMTYLEDGGQRF